MLPEQYKLILILNLNFGVKQEAEVINATIYSGHSQIGLINASLQFICVYISPPILYTQHCKERKFF